MNLKQAQEYFLRDAKYRQQYEKHKYGVELAMHVTAIRKELGISYPNLASELGISKYAISKFENLKGRVEPWVISAIVMRFQDELRKRGVQVERWFVTRPANHVVPPTPTGPRDAHGKRAINIQTSRQSNGPALTSGRRRISSAEKEESKA
jgi:DNA-binding transcriptional regulator YiaG